MDIRRVDIADIRRDCAKQLRQHGTNEAVVKEYAARSTPAPPVVVFADGEVFWLGDGDHRLEAAIRRGETAIDAEVRDHHESEAGQRAAFLYACGCNDHPANGFRRSNEDKRKAVERVLTDPTWTKNSSRWIADVCGVGDQLVNTMRQSTACSRSSPEPETRTGKDGKKRRVKHKAKTSESDTEMKTENAGWRKRTIDYGEVERLHNEGLGTTEIAKHLGSPATSISNAKVALGISETSPAYKATRLITSIADNFPEALISAIEEQAAKRTELTLTDKELRQCLRTMKAARTALKKLIAAYTPAHTSESAPMKSA